jgi:hypothetical protein
MGRRSVVTGHAADDGRPIPEVARHWSPFFTGVETRLVERRPAEGGAGLGVVSPAAPWILLAAETHVGDRGTGVAHGVLSDVDGTFGRCQQSLIFERRR